MEKLNKQINQQKGQEFQYFLLVKTLLQQLNHKKIVQNAFYKYLEKFRIDIRIDSEFLVKDQQLIQDFVCKIRKLNYNLFVSFDFDSYEYLLKQENVIFMKNYIFSLPNLIGVQYLFNCCHQKSEIIDELAKNLQYVKRLQYYTQSMYDSDSPCDVLLDSYCFQNIKHFQVNADCQTWGSDFTTEIIENICKYQKLESFRYNGPQFYKENIKQVAQSLKSLPQLKTLGIGFDIDLLEQLSGMDKLQELEMMLCMGSKFKFNELTDYLLQKQGQIKQLILNFNSKIQNDEQQIVSILENLRNMKYLENIEIIHPGHTKLEEFPNMLDFLLTLEQKVQYIKIDYWGNSKNGLKQEKLEWFKEKYDFYKNQFKENNKILKLPVLNEQI